MPLPSLVLARVAEADGGAALTAAVSLADAKRHLNIYHAQDDALITGMVATAQAAIEGADGTGGPLGRPISRHTIDLTAGDWPDGRALVLPVPDVVSVTHVKYLDATETEQTLAASQYHVVKTRHDPHILLKPAASWPSLADRPDAVRVRFLVGPTECPADIRAALLLHVGHLYANREAAGESATVLPMGYKHLLDPYRTHGWV